MGFPLSLVHIDVQGYTTLSMHRDLFGGVYYLSSTIYTTNSFLTINFIGIGTPDSNKNFNNPTLR